MYWCFLNVLGCGKYFKIFSLLNIIFVSSSKMTDISKMKKIAILKILALMELEEKEVNEKKHQHRRMWVNPFLCKRELYSIEDILLKDVLWDDKEFTNFTRINYQKFEELLEMVTPFIRKKDTTLRFAISARVRLALTLRFIATGDSYRSLEMLSRVSRKTISKFVPEVLHAIYRCLQPNYLKVCETTEEWLKVAGNFNNIWNFPHSLGAIDGKHIRIKGPPKQGSNFCNYKGFHSIILLAVVDANSAFIYIDVGSNGRASDSTIFENSLLLKNLQYLNLPEPEIIEDNNEKLPYFFIGDGAFKFDKVMKPYSRCLKLTTKQKIFNYRISRARLTVECAFGRLAARFRIFHRPIEVDVNTTEKVVKACCAIHNFLLKSNELCKVNDDIDINKIFSSVNQGNTKITNDLHASREMLSNYFISNGEVSFQWEKI